MIPQYTQALWTGSLNLEMLGYTNCAQKVDDFKWPEFHVHVRFWEQSVQWITGLDVAWNALCLASWWWVCSRTNPSKTKRPQTVNCLKGLLCGEVSKIDVCVRSMLSDVCVYTNFVGRFWNDKTSLSKVNSSKRDPKKYTDDVLIARFEISRKSVEIEVIDR